MLVSMQEITEAQIETSAIEALQALGWDYQHGLAIVPEAEKSERESFEQVLLLPRLRRAIARLDTTKAATKAGIEPDLLRQWEKGEE